MRKYMTKQIIQSTIKSAKIELVEGVPKAIELPDEVVMGKYSNSRAQKYIDEKYKNAMVVQVNVEKLVYEMEVEEFIKLAELKEEL